MEYCKIRELAAETMQQMYCDKFNQGSVIPSPHCENCPLHVIDDDLDSLCVTGLYEKIFIEGYEQNEKHQN